MNYFWGDFQKRWVYYFISSKCHFVKRCPWDKKKHIKLLFLCVFSKSLLLFSAAHVLVLRRLCVWRRWIQRCFFKRESNALGPSGLTCCLRLFLHHRCPHKKSAEGPSRLAVLGKWSPFFNGFLFVLVLSVTCLWWMKTLRSGGEHHVSSGQTSADSSVMAAAPLGRRYCCKTKCLRNPVRTKVLLCTILLSVKLLTAEIFSY